MRCEGSSKELLKEPLLNGNGLWQRCKCENRLSPSMGQDVSKRGVREVIPNPGRKYTLESTELPNGVDTPGSAGHNVLPLS